nr:hypothetical protein Iba_chr09aCG11980 [Ipomoea batatas]
MWASCCNRRAWKPLAPVPKDCVDEAVHNAHGLTGDSNVGMDLLQNLEDVDQILEPCFKLIPIFFKLPVKYSDLLLPRPLKEVFRKSPGTY